MTGGQVLGVAILAALVLAALVALWWAGMSVAEILMGLLLTAVGTALIVTGISLAAQGVPPWSPDSSFRITTHQEGTTP